MIITRTIVPGAGKSQRGALAATAFLLAVPVAALSQVVTPDGASLVIHVMLGAGAAIMALAIPDYRTPRWITLTGITAIGSLAVIFLLQAVAEGWRNPSLTHVAYDVLGQALEAWLGDLFVLWCVAVVLFDSAGWRRTLGMAVTAVVVAMRVYAHVLTVRGTTIGAEAPVLQALPLLLFIWLLLESLRARGDA